MAQDEKAKGTYVVKGNKVYVTVGKNDRDTLTLSADGSQLMATLEDQKLVMKRMK